MKRTDKPKSQRRRKEVIENVEEDASIVMETKLRNGWLKEVKELKYLESELTSQESLQQMYLGRYRKGKES